MSSIQGGGSDATFWNTTPTFGTPSHRAAGPRRNNENTNQTARNRPASPIQGGGSGATFLNTIPSNRRAINQTARNTMYGEGSGAAFGTPPHRDAGLPTRPQQYRVGVLDHFSMTGEADQPFVAARNNHVCLDNPPKTNTRPSPRPKQAAWDQYYGARPTP